MNYDISCVLDQQPQAGAIYISDLRSARSTSCRKKHNILSIISVAIGANLTESIGSHLNYLHFAAKDHPHYDLKQHFEETFEFIEKARSKGNILVHCMAGISRSAAIVAAYLIRKQFLSAQQAITVIQSRRNVVNPNIGFRQQLKVFQKEIQNLGKSELSKENISPNVSFQFKLLECQNIDQQSKISSIPSCNLQMKKSGKLQEVSAISMQLSSSIRTKSKTVSKIQKIKANMANQLEKSSKVEDGFQNLLVSNIYRNKLRLR